MQRFKEILETLNPADHIKEIELYQEGELIGSIKSKPGSMGSIKVYFHLFETFGEINGEAAMEGIDLYAEHTEDAHNNPGKHPNIDRLLDVIDNETTLQVKIINN
jgi:hypothetical protein